MAFVSLLLSFIDPVRSSTTMMSSGTPPHGEQAVACTVSGIESTPISFRKKVGTLPVSVTCTVFAGSQNLGLVAQFVTTSVFTFETPGTAFFAPGSLLKS